jgi:hypothetical protein
MDVDVDIVLDADQDDSVVVTTTQDSTAVYNADFTGAGTCMLVNVNRVTKEPGLACFACCPVAHLYFQSKGLMGRDAAERIG